jgi:hypothetical protein
VLVMNSITHLIKAIMKQNSRLRVVGLGSWTRQIKQQGSRTYQGNG